LDEATRRILRLCLRVRWQPQAAESARAAVSGGIAVCDSLVEVARREGVAPLLYHSTRGLAILPPEVEAQLHVDYWRTAGRNTLWFRELEQALTRLARAGISVILLKGAAMAQAVYGNVALRPMADLDLLVREGHVAAASEALSELGYQSSGQVELRARDIHANQLMLRGPEPADAVIELHWALFWFPHYRRIAPTEWLWATARPVRVEGVGALALGNEAQLLHACGHLLHHDSGDRSFRMLWLVDVVEFVNRHGRDVDWGMLAAKATTSDLVLAVREVLEEVAEDWLAPIPDGALLPFRTARPSASEVRARSWLAATTASMDRYPMASLAALPHWGSKIRFLWRDLLFPSLAFMRCRYNVPHPLLVPFYYPYRWLKGLARALASR